MSVSYPFHRVLWCVDVLADDIRVYPKATGALLENVIDHHATEVELVYVLHPKAFRVPVNEFAQWIEFYRKIAEDGLRDATSTMNWPIQTKTTVLVTGDDSQAHAAETVSKYALKTKADVIALATHSRKGMKRTFMGSFAESLVTRSSLPLLIVDPLHDKTSRVTKILHASDLMESSKGAFTSIFPIAKRLNAEVVLYHDIVPPFSIFPPPGFVAQPAWDRVERLARETAAHWVSEAEKEGVKVQLRISGFGGPVSKNIAGAAQEVGADLISLQVNASSEKNFFASHHVRKLVRETTRPILTIPQ